MNIPLVDLKAQYDQVRTEVRSAIDNVLSNTAFIGGEQVRIFEEGFAKYVGVNHCISCGNGTDALVLALKGLGIGPGHEVIVPANSFIATSEAVTCVGGRPVFVDCDEATYNLDSTLVEAAVTSNTKAIIAVHLYGMPGPMKELAAIAEKHGLFLIEDASQAHGAKLGERSVGTMSDVATFSFYPGKNLGAYGDAGAVVTNRKNLAEFIAKYANHGRSAKYDHDMEGVNSRMDGLQAAVLNVKLKYLDSWLEKRIAIAAKYRELLDAKQYRYTLPLENVRHVYHLFVVRVHRRADILKELAHKGIQAGIHYPIALPFLNAYKHLNHISADFPVAHKLADEILSLPIYPELTQMQVEYVATHLNAAVKPLTKEAP
ncbi:MAG: DegT/DnrJ/EryC1/StrS family aminotransferase [Flavobacteriales bacterium]|nr:DegT/DnrJ/EryC1/StrS family aminotransferase [Flavobacteriales bacterium]